MSVSFPLLPMYIPSNIFFTLHFLNYSEVATVPVTLSEVLGG